MNCQDINGSAGSVSINSKIVTVSGRFAKISSEVLGQSDVDAGDIILIADDIRLEKSAKVTSANSGAGLAGEIKIFDFNNLEIYDELIISTEFAAAGGGSIELRHGGLVYLDSSEISNSVADSTGNAGDITIVSSFLALNSSAILAQAEAGVGGDIRIVTENLILSPDSDINAEAGDEGVDGTIFTSSPEVDLTGGLLVLDGQFVDASRLLRESCETGGDVGGSSFVEVGKAPAITSGDELLPGFYSSALATDDDGSLNVGKSIILAFPCG